MELAPSLVEGLIYGLGSRQRWTQDSPVLPDVWAYYATPSEDRPPSHPLVPPRTPRGSTKGNPKKKDLPEEPLELLLTPHYNASPAVLARELNARLDVKRQGETDRKKRNIAYTQSYVAARLYFDEVVQVVLPLTSWWRQVVWKDVFRDEDDDAVDDRTLRDLLQLFQRKDLVGALETWGKTQSPETFSRETVRRREFWERAEIQAEGLEAALSNDLLWMVLIIGTIQWGRDLTPKSAKDRGLLDDDDRIAYLPPKKSNPDEVDYRPLVDAACDLLEVGLPVVQSAQASLWQINRNRPAAPAVRDSRRAIKADAGIHLFDIHCDSLAWAVIDSGIDATHPAFLTEKASDDSEKPPPWHKRTRVQKTYDFTRLRPLLNQEVAREILNVEVDETEVEDPQEAWIAAWEEVLDDDVFAILRPVLGVIYREDRAEKARAEAEGKEWFPEDGRLRGQLGDLMKRLEDSREVDWQVLEPLLEVPHHDPNDEDYRYPVPASDHGTHVAGILAGRWKNAEREVDFEGICPDLPIYDLRVLDPHGPNDEFTVLAALQFVQFLNLQKELLTIHGANLSLSIRHDVSTYACGRTPVCEECERLVASGVVVVAAGGNDGWDKDLAQAGPGAGYRTVSITDPGNAEAVITVGATHRDKPHTYGVSFFSSRGPTGDGRAKPDLVAPGEKITSTIPGKGFKRDDGTSMAAPHVSGAAALLMARHHELVGQPRTIKRILCETATDLGRERDFQGAGMLDVLRALQSV